MSPSIVLLHGTNAGPWTMQAAADGSHASFRRYLDRVFGIDHFGASAPYERIYAEFGLTAAAAVQHAHRLLGT